MRTITSFIFLISVKYFSKIFYKLEKTWISEIKEDFKRIRLIIFLNHTSLYEPLFLQAAPNWFIWRLSRKMIAPAASKTLDRPIVGKLWRLMGRFVSISRKRDRTWITFLELLKKRHTVVIAPEGRMKRDTGLDSNGKPMTVRSGVAEVLEMMEEGRMLIIYSGGLHHVQHPGELLPRLFKTIKLNGEILEVSDYKSQFPVTSSLDFRRAIVADLEQRLRTKCPNQ